MLEVNNFRLSMSIGGETKILIQIWISAFASLSYCYFISFNIPKGKFRFISLLPVLYVLATLPFKSNSVILGSLTAFFLTWLANFKLLLFSFGEGPLSIDPSISLSHFISIACFPIKVKNKQQQSLQKSNLNITIKVLLVILLSLLHGHAQNLHPMLVLAYDCCYLYVGLEFDLLVVATLVGKFLAIELEQQFDEPYLSTSLQDFWGRRWNLMVNHVLKPTVYSPTKLVLTNKIGRDYAQLSAVFLTFIVSGLMHEVTFYYMGRLTPSWEVTCFFVLHGLLLVLEIWVKKLLKGKWRLHPLISGALTVGILVITSDWLFFPPMRRFQTDIRARREVATLLDYFRALSKSIGISSF